MDEIDQRPAVPGWYWLAAFGALLFYAAGCYGYYLQVTTDPKQLPIDQRAFYDATPFWITGAYAVAVWAGLAGAVGLLLRKAFAPAALMLALVAMLVQFGGILLVPALRTMTPSDELLLPTVILVVAYAIWHFAHNARRRGWLD